MAVELNYERRGRRDLGEAGALVLLHGIGSRWQIWEPVLDRLAAERDVVALDLPGFGFSPMPDGEVEPGAGSLARLVAHFLRDELGLERPHVAGNSLGGWIGLELAKRGLARSVTALSPAGFYTQAEAIWMMAALRLSRSAARRWRRDLSHLAFHPAVRRVVLAQFFARPEQLPAFEAAESIRALADAPWFDETLRAIGRERMHARRPLDVPVTIAWGERDRLLLPRQATRAAAEIPGATMLTLRGCGHVPTYDDPEQVTRVLLDGSAEG
jgi:pimeloyl-ACP methyl ester carboxylesterase